MSAPIDLVRVRRAMANLHVEGRPTTPARMRLLEEAMAAIQADGEKALRTEYMGIKNYAHFGDQREDHGYGYGPKHGYIVFSVGRKRTGLPRLGADEVYALECLRDFGSHTRSLQQVRDIGVTAGPYQYPLRDESDLNLFEVVTLFDRASALAATLYEVLAATKVESHEVQK